MPVSIDFAPLPDEISALEKAFPQPWYRRLLCCVGLQTKLTWAFILLMAVTLASYGLVSLQDTQRRLKDNLTAEAQQVSATMAVLVADLPPGIAPRVLSHAAEPLFQSGPDVLFVQVLDADGVAQSTLTRNGEQPDRAAWGSKLVRSSPVKRGGLSGGEVRVGVSMAVFHDQQVTTAVAAGRVGMALILLTIPTAWLIVRRIFTPIRSLVTAAQRIAGGEFDTRVETHRHDLIGDLARAFNHMMQTITRQQAALRRANEKLAEANHDLEAKIEQRTKQLETANKSLNVEIAEKEDFLRAISHDLNAPLRNISGMVTMLQTKKKDQLDDDAKHRLDRIKKNVEVETDLINELLELSRIKTRRGEMEPIDMERMVWDLRGVFENDLRTRGIDLIVDTHLPSLHAEKARMRQVFQNLIDNAIKYMGEGSIREIHVGCDLRNDEAEFYVRDTGQGIDAEDLGKVFFVFRRGKNQGTQAVAGKGIGLASVKSIVETHSGKIWVESDVGRGSTFKFTINGQHVPAIGGKTIQQFKEQLPLAA